MRAAWIAVALGACGDPAVELTLRLPASSTIPATYDLKCVGAIDMVAIAEDAELLDIGQQYLFSRKRPPCVDLARPPENFTDIRNAMRGKFEIPIPLEGLLGIQVRGRVGTCADESLGHEAMFYGGALYDGGDELTVPLVANISCNTKRDYEVRPVDLLSLTTTKACPAPVASGVVFAGTIRPTLLAPKRQALMYEGGTSEVAPTNGTAIVASYANLATSDSCVAMGFTDDKHVGATCINAAAPTVCGEANEIELPTLPGDLMEAAIDDALEAELGTPTFVAAWETAPAKLPLSGATVTVPDPAHTRVVYLDLIDARLAPRTGQTGASGMFAVYTDRITEITVEAPGHAPRKLLVGGTPELFGTAVAVLARI